MKTKRNCPVCSLDEAYVITAIEMDIPDHIHLPDKYNIVCCKNCGMCYADTSASEKDYDEYYNQNNYYGGWGGNSTSLYTYSIIKKILGKITSEHTSIVDIGCGNGTLLKYLNDSRAGSCLCGIDPSENSIEKLREQGIHGEVGSIYTAPSTGEKYSVAIFTAVLEHLFDPGKAIASIKNNYLKSGGYILVCWPCFDDLLSDDSPVLNNFNHEHINYFSVLSADRLFSKFGFERVESHISVEAVRGEQAFFSHVVLYKDSENSSSGECPFDHMTCESIREYVNRVSRKEKDSIEYIKKLEAIQSPVAVFGTGAYLMHFMAVSSLKRCNILHFADNNKMKQGKFIYGHEIEAPECLESFDGTVLIASMLHADEIRQQLCKIKRFDDIYTL